MRLRPSFGHEDANALEIAIFVNRGSLFSVAAYAWRSGFGVTARTFHLPRGDTGKHLNGCGVERCGVTQDIEVARFVCHGNQLEFRVARTENRKAMR